MEGGSRLVRLARLQGARQGKARQGRRQGRQPAGKELGGEVYMDYAKQGCTNTVEMITYGLGFDTEEAIEDNQYEDLASSLTPDLGHSLRTTKEIIAQHFQSCVGPSAHT